MTKPVGYVTALVFIIVTLISTLTHYQKADFSVDKKQISSEQTSITYGFKWKQVFENHDAFASGEPEKTSEEPLVAPKTTDILSAKLIAIVTDSLRTVMLISPESIEPITLQVGDSWLDGWILAEINPDSVSWENQESKQVRTQYLYGSAEPSEQEKLTTKVNGKP